MSAAVRAAVPVASAGNGSTSRRILCAGVLAGLAGAALIAGHARHLAVATISTVDAAEVVHAANVYQAVMPGARFAVPATPGVGLDLQPDGVMLVAAGMRAAPPVRVDLCSQLSGANTTRMAPLRLGYRFDDVGRWVAKNQAAAQPVALHNVLLVDAAPDAAQAMPEVQISGILLPGFADPASAPLRLQWHSAQGQARWVSDATLGQIEEGQAGQVALREQGWLLWGGGGDGAALRVERRTNVMCPQAGELVVQLFRQAPPAKASAPAARALVVAFPARGKPLSAWLAPGQYQIPVAARSPLEDQTLFQQLLDKGLVRLDADGAIEAAPRDLAQWLASPPAGRATMLAGWQGVSMDAATGKLLKRLYSQADGAYVRQQIDIYNDERRLLAWRVQSNNEGLAGPRGDGGSGAEHIGDAVGTQAEATDAQMAGTVAAGDQPWIASAGAEASGGSSAPNRSDTAARPLRTTRQMPASAARLFADLPQGWQPWTRIARWPPASRHAPVRLTLPLPRAAAGDETLTLLVAGHVLGARGARMRARPACTGRGCAAPDDVQQITLHVDAGARSVQLDVAALTVSAPENRKYRHLRVDGGRLAWQSLDEAGGATGAVAGLAPHAPVQVQLQDRNGTPLWSDGAPTRPALDAGLAPLLGFGADHANSVAGMLARLPARAGAPVHGRLTLDLPLQALSQQVLECVGMRRGRWDGRHCAGGHAGPEGRHAGLVVLDTETGDVLAAAGAGAGVVSGANWAEVRAFDRANPARSALRLPALQHDGGIHQSPGSTFKIVSALGLELAAQQDGQIDALLAGMPLQSINRFAAQRGFAFQTDAATYPANPGLAHITNYREQSLDRRAQEGRLGLAQALTYSLNTWFAWSGELSDRSLFGRADGGAPDLQALDADALDDVRPIVAAAHRLGFEQALRMDGGLLPADFRWQSWDALQATPAHIDPIHTRHELRQMSIGLRMQATPLQMALAAGAVGQGGVVVPRLLLALDGASSTAPPVRELGIRLDRIRAGMKGVIDAGTAASAFGGPALAALRPHLYGKTGTAPSGDDIATVWFAGWLEPGSLPGQGHRLALAAFVSHSEASGGEHAAPVVAAILATLAGQATAQSHEQRVK